MKTDEEILEERGEKYGPMRPMWDTIGKIQWANFLFLHDKLNGKEPAPEDLGHLAAMNMVAVKMTRGIYDPNEMDHYQDARNYLTIAETIRLVAFEEKSELTETVNQGGSDEFIKTKRV